MNEHEEEIKTGKRFTFGDNWSKFLQVLNEDRIAIAESSLKKMLGIDDLKNRTFIDVGSGSGLFSLAARKLGANVHSFDYDPQSVACTQELRNRYFPDDPRWRVEQASVLDKKYLTSLGQFDIVYSWGVLHHTGAMWEALENAAGLVKLHGELFIAIYNDQGGASRRWAMLKKIYNKLPNFLRPLYTILVMAPRELKFLAFDTLKGKPWNYFKNIVNYSKNSARGMSYWHDIVDWIGGYPFEVAKPEAIFNFYRKLGFELRNLKTVGSSLACNQFIFEKSDAMLIEKNTP